MLNIDKYKINIKDLKCREILKDFNFKSTEEIEPIKGIIGQDRAVKAIEFGLKMNQKGYNIYVSGMSGTGRSSYTNTLIRKNKIKKTLKDWVYVEEL